MSKVPLRCRLLHSTIQAMWGELPLEGFSEEKLLQGMTIPCVKKTVIVKKVRVKELYVFEGLGRDQD